MPLNGPKHAVIYHRNSLLPPSKSLVGARHARRRYRDFENARRILRTVRRRRTAGHGLAKEQGDLPVLTGLRLKALLENRWSDYAEGSESARRRSFPNFSEMLSLMTAEPAHCSWQPAQTEVVIRLDRAPASFSAWIDVRAQWRGTREICRRARFTTPGRPSSIAWGRTARRSAASAIRKILRQVLKPISYGGKP